MSKENQKVIVKITFTEGYEKRFTEAILKIYANRIRKQKMTTNLSNNSCCSFSGFHG